MRQKSTKFLLVMLALLCFLCTACAGNTGGAEDGTMAPQGAPDEGLGGDVPALNEDTVNDFSMYEGIWLGDADNQYDYIEFDLEGNWQLYLAGDVVDEGYLRYEPEWESVYAYSSLDDSGSRVALENGQLYITSFGYFNYGDGMEYYWYEDGNGDHGGGLNGGALTEDDEANNWEASLYQHDVSAFEGIWYYDGDLSAMTYIVIDGYGNWSYYQRAPGAEPEEMDCGTFSYSTDEESTYYADSVMYDGVSYRVYEMDVDMLIWGDEGTYYLMER